MRTWIPRFATVAVVALSALQACRSTPARTGRDDLPSRLTALIEHEMKTEALPAFSIALVDRDGVRWARPFGHSDPEKGTPATADTVYRAGSVSKLFTDIAVMQLVERGELDLDAPVTTYLPDFRPENPFTEPITLRQLMCHRAGLVREPPVGHYFDPTEPTLAMTVASLNRTTLVHSPGDRTKYSNAGISVVGRVLEALKGQPFAQYVKEAVLVPMGLRHSAFEKEPALAPRVAGATMWTVDERPAWKAPRFELGIAPAAGLYATVGDLAEFVRVLLLEGESEHGHILDARTLEAMWQLQFPNEGAKQGYGLGFFVKRFDGHRQVGHDGAVYGFSTTVAVLPDAGLGVVAVSTRDVTHDAVERIADYALRGMLAERDGDALPEIVTLPRVPRRERVAGLDGEPLLPEIVTPTPDRFRGLIGEYGWDHNVLFIYESGGDLCALIEWIYGYRLTEVAEDTFEMERGLYHGERLAFERDANGRATHVSLSGVVFRRRDIGPADGETFRIEPLKPTAELRRDALGATPPPEAGDFRAPELVDLATLDPTLKFDIRYATTNNFMGAAFYKQSRAYLQRPAAEALVRVHRKLQAQGYGLLIHDAYRPWHVTKMFWDATPQRYRHFVANPDNGSRHNRGCAVDVTLFRLATGEPVKMVAGFDEFTERAYPHYPGGTSRQRVHRWLLRESMAAEGFTIYEFEWWHFDYRDWRAYGIQNLTFEEIERLTPTRNSK